MTRHTYRQAARKRRKAEKEQETVMAARHWHWCAKCQQQTWHVWGGEYGWICTWPEHHNPRWRKAGDALKYLNKERP